VSSQCLDSQAAQEHGRPRTDALDGESLQRAAAGPPAAPKLEQKGRFPGWRLHPLKGFMKGYWSLTVTGNWRMVFRYHEPSNTASDIDLIDYH
jgi:proteic killer suppression protein